MQDEIQPMISGRLIAAPKNCIVEEIGKSGKGAIQSRFPSGPPVSMFENKRDILGRDFPDAGIKEKSLIIQDESGLK
jgi:hypothetical protein